MKLTKIAILQSCYIPWKGYFDIIGAVDMFVVYDEVQYRKNHWHNRNLIKTRHGVKWLTIPVSLPRGLATPIEQVTIAKPFADRHWRSLSQSYSRCSFFQTYGPFFEHLYNDASKMNYLSDINMLFIKEISVELGIKTNFLFSSSLKVEGNRTDRIVEICTQLGASIYVTGPAAKSYLNLSRFDAAGIAVEWINYSCYPSYDQLYEPFDHHVSIVDLLLHTGPDARRFMKTPRTDAT